MFKIIIGIFVLKCICDYFDRWYAVYITAS